MDTLPDRRAAATTTLWGMSTDNRANGVVVPITDTRQLEVVFGGTSTAATCHFIFDLTGYFVPKT